MFVPFLGRAFHMDDPLFLWAAKHIQTNPAHPYDFIVNWYGVEQPMSIVMENPPLASYFLALVGLLIGLSALFAPFKGGVLVPNPSIMIFGLPTGPAGVLPLTAHWPAGLPASFTLYFQHWILDPGGPAGLAASNGLSGTTPP